MIQTFQDISNIGIFEDWVKLDKNLIIFAAFSADKSFCIGPPSLSILNVDTKAWRVSIENIYYFSLTRCNEIVKSLVEYSYRLYDPKFCE